MTARCSRPLLCMYVDARVCVTDRHACSMGTAVTVHIQYISRRRQGARPWRRKSLSEACVRGGSKSRSRIRSAARSQASFALEISPVKWTTLTCSLPTFLNSFQLASIQPTLCSSLFSSSSASIIIVSASATRDIHLLCVRPRRAPSGQSACSSRATSHAHALCCFACAARLLLLLLVQGPLTRLGPRCYSQSPHAAY